MDYKGLNTSFLNPFKVKVILISIFEYVLLYNLHVWSASNSISACCCEFVFIITFIWERNVPFHQICKVNNL